ncbi:MAG: dTDP-4-dehydrorhamnose reductase [Parasphingopyxis sp.]|uniref:dTDP-4-dehydrorhamnose reductase n=1 Tax=Parasphingopyxis sp. TaxID=1920299 RepID=UPI003FA0CC6D
MKALIFGANGQLGRALRLTRPAAWDVTGLTRREVDITDADAVDRSIAATHPDIVVNTAAYNAVDDAEGAAETAFRINGEAPGGIARSCARHGARLIHISTDYVFDGAGDTPFAPDSAPDPLSVYGRSKRAGEIAVLDQSDGLVLRTSWLYAGYGRNFLTTMLRLMKERDELGVVADQTGTPTHAESLARAIWALAGAEASGIHHFTDRGQTTWHGFATAIEERARRAGVIDGCRIVPITTADYAAAAARPPFSLLDCRQTWAITGEPRAWDTELDIALDIWKAFR